MATHRPLGYTLLELTLVLVLAGTLLGVAVPRGAAVLDRIAVTVARDIVAASLARTRALAISRGGATLVLRRRPLRLRIEDATGTLAPGGNPALPHGIELETSGTDAEIQIRYDALGIGRLASRTLRFRRGDAVATLVLSSYGRVTRQ